MKDDIDAKVGSDWDVVAYDWKEWSNFFPNFTKDRRDLTNFLAPSYSLARHVGKDCLGKLLAQYKNYKFIHFVSHSLGAWVINEAGQVVKKTSPGTQIHMTFLDAYVPPQMVGRDGLGRVADWSEQYVDMDGLKNTPIPGLDFTNAGDYKPYTDQVLKDVDCNVDVTALKTNPLEGAHGWPIVWFRSTIADPSAFGLAVNGWGFPATKESSGQFPHHPSCAGGKVHLAKVLDAPGPDYRSRFKLPPDISLKGPIQLNSFTKGTTGTTTNGNQTLISGSPVWISGNVQSAAGDNALSIEYKVSGGDGVLEVLVDDAPAWFVTYTGGELSLDDTIIDLGAIPAGSHTLTIQLDPMGDQKSTVSISSIRFASVQLGGDEPDPPTVPPSATSTAPAPSASPAPSGTRAPLPPNTGSGTASERQRPTTVVIVGLLILTAGAAGATLSGRRKL